MTGCSNEDPVERVGAQTWLGCLALLPCPPTPCLSCSSLSGPLLTSPFILDLLPTTSHILQGKECHLASYLPPLWLAGEGDLGEGVRLTSLLSYMVI